MYKQRGRSILRATFVASVLAGSLTFGQPAQADDAMKILQAMSKYVAGQNTISAKFDSSVEVITPELEKIQFTSSGQLRINRPDKLHFSRTGGYADVDLIYDGKTATIYGKGINKYAQIDAAGSIDQFIERLRNDTFIDAPGADLLLSNPYETLAADVLEAKHIGQGVVDNVDCEHLAFRNHDTDWQLWVETGAQPIPHKLVITSKTVTGGPQYTLVIKDWKTDAPADAAAFAFKAPAGAAKVEVKALAEMNEVPVATMGGKK